MAARACQELDASVDVPWVILSAGVGYEAFRAQLEIACEAGASGYLAGRSIWRDAITQHAPVARANAIAEARGRLDELNEVTRKYGRPFCAVKPLNEVLVELPAEWYRDWHANGQGPAVSASLQRAPRNSPPSAAIRESREVAR